MPGDSRVGIAVVERQFHVYCTSLAEGQYNVPTAASRRAAPPRVIQGCRLAEGHVETSRACALVFDGVLVSCLEGSYARKSKLDGGYLCRCLAMSEAWYRLLSRLSRNEFLHPVRRRVHQQSYGDCHERKQRTF